MFFTTLFSGSGGNSCYIKDKDTEILIDAGGSARRIECALKELDTSFSNISAVYITHEHTDHVSSLNVLLKSHKIPVYVTEQSARCMCDDANRDIMHECIYTINPGNVYETGSIAIMPFATPHDSVMSVGYRICTSKECLGYATDTGHVTDTMRKFLSGCKRVVIESNHDVQMLKDGVYPPYLKRRILSDVGHLSNDDCAKFACELAKSGCESIMLAHLSKENNTPDTAYNATKKALEAHGAIIGRDVKLNVAAEKCISNLC